MIHDIDIKMEDGGRGVILIRKVMFSVSNNIQLLWIVGIG